MMMMIDEDDDQIWCCLAQILWIQSCCASEAIYTDGPLTRELTSLDW